MSKKRNSKKPPLPLAFLEPRGILGLGAYLASMPLWGLAPNGDPHPVMVIPGFLADDVMLAPLRFFIQKLGYKVYPWGLGRNLAQRENELRLIRQVRSLSRKYQQKVSLVGWSLGGVYARETARIIPEDIRQVITLSSPFSGLNEPNHANWIYELISGSSTKHANNELFERMKEPIDIPHTSIYSKLDGIVHWENCMNQYTSPIAENVEVYSSHWGIIHHPVVMHCIADRLAQEAHIWTPFKAKGIERFLYPR